MKKLLVICGDKEYAFDIDNAEFEILNDEYSYELDDDEFDDNEFAEFMCESDDLVVEIIKDHEAFSNIDFDDTQIEYYIARDNYDIVVNLIIF
jgi:hypothetical protein